MINDTIRKTETTEDGDYIYTHKVECDTADDAREMTESLKNRYGYEEVIWEGKGGKMVWTHDYMVSGTEVAIEASNDYWASMRDMGTPEQYL